MQQVNKASVLEITAWSQIICIVETVGVDYDMNSEIARHRKSSRNGWTLAACLLGLISLVSAKEKFASNTAKSGHAVAELLLPFTQVPRDTRISLGVSLKADDGWHSYWFNPGAGGMANQLIWQMPEGWTLLAVDYPPPTTFSSMDLVSSGYTGEVVMVAEFSIDQDAPLGAQRLDLEIKWLTCNDEACVPGQAELSADVEVTKAAEKAIPNAHQPKVEKAIEQLPGAYSAIAQVKATPTHIEWTVATDQPIFSANAEYYCAQANLIAEAGKARISKRNGTQVVALPRNEYFTDLPEKIDLLIVQAKPDQAKWLRNYQK